MAYLHAVHSTGSVQPYPSMALRPPSWPGTDPDTIGWTANLAGDAPPQVPHYPSKLVREGRIRNFVPNFGIEDRGDGGGVVAWFPNRRR